MIGRAVLALAALAAAWTAPVGAQLPTHPDDGPALAGATKALCSRRIALLGEANHGDARTEQFKIALIERLVDRCGFTAVVFEASFYEFVALERARQADQPVTRERLATAIGGLWRYNRTFQPLLPWLADRVTSGKLRIGGIDLQQGGQGQDYANFGLTAELTEGLPADRRDSCRTAFRDHLFKGFAAERKVVLQSCLDAIRTLPEPSDAQARREHRAMLDMLGRFLALDPRDQRAFFAGRDQAMFDLLAWWQAGWPAGTKVIIWTATVHAARDATPEPRWAGLRNLGSLVAERHGRRAFALGFGALGGTTRSFPAPRAIAPAEAGSLERLAIPDDQRQTAFLSAAALRRAGRRTVGLFTHQRLTADWSQIVDGAVIFPAEAAAADIRKDR